MLYSSAIGRQDDSFFTSSAHGEFLERANVDHADLFVYAGYRVLQGRQALLHGVKVASRESSFHPSTYVLFFPC